MRTVDKKAVAENIYEEVQEWLEQCPVSIKIDDEDIWEACFEKVNDMEEEAGDMQMEEERERKYLGDDF